jgi:predicted AlkP superfamily phosphohydrolase/phosphomutase
MTKTVVLGLDGLSPYMVEELLDEGELPNFQRLIDGGVFGELRSTVPPSTIPAWPSMFSGLNAGKYGVFNFMNPLQEKKKGLDLQVIDASYWEGDMVWDYMTEQGKTTGVIEVPATNPPREIDGFMVTAFLGAKKATYPPELEGEIDSNVSAFDIKDPNEFMRTAKKKEHAEELMKARFSLSEYLRKEKEWDTYIFVINLPDWALHRANDREEILDVYRKVDEELGDLIDEIEDNNWNLLALSDHGGCKVTKRFYLNSWLEQEGFLVQEEGSDDTRKNLLLRLGDKLQALGVSRDLLKTLNSFRKKVTGNQILEGKSGIRDKLDWDRTQAFCYMTGNNHIGIWINSEDTFSMGCVSDDEKEGVIQEITDRLKALNKEQGEEIIEDVHRREDIFHGPETHQLPEIIVQTKDDISMMSELHPNVFTDAKAFIHHLYGTLIAYGPAFKQGKRIEGTELHDIAPTLLQLNDCWIPEKMDGSVMRELFNRNVRPEYRQDDDLDI